MFIVWALKKKKKQNNGNAHDHIAQGKKEYSRTIIHNDPKKANILPQLYLIKVLQTGFSACITDIKK